MNMNWYKIAKKTDHHYSWVYLDLPKEICKLMKEFGEQIDPDDLFVDEADEGLETDFHTTIKYAILTKDVKEIKECLEGLKGGKVHMGSSSVFECEKYDVVKITVESKELDKLHEILNRLPHEDKYMEYKSHATIAYVKKGCGKKYNKKFKLNKNFRFSEVYFGNNKKDYTIKLALFNNYLHKKAMALDPNAYKTESQPARLQTHMDEELVWRPSTGLMEMVPKQQNQEEIDALYSGVHFAFTPEQAALYACGKATITDPPVLIEIEPKGLKQQKDVDAMVDQGLRYYLDEKIPKWQSIIQSGEDQEIIADQLLGDVESDFDNWTIEGEVNDTVDDIIMQQQLPIPPGVIKNLITKKSPQQIINIINGLISGNIPEKLLIKMVGQMRVNNSIDSSRVKAIYQIPWIDLNGDVSADVHSMDEDRRNDYLEEQGWRMNGDDVINEKGQIVPSYEELVEDQWLSLTTLYKNNQIYFRGYISKDSIWHGTTLSRAKQAYPELLGDEMGAIAEKVNHIKLEAQSTNKLYMHMPDSMHNNYGVCMESKDQDLLKKFTDFCLGDFDKKLRAFWQSGSHEYGEIIPDYQFFEFWTDNLDLIISECDRLEQHMGMPIKGLNDSKMIEASTKSWYKPPFMRSMDYVPLKNSKKQEILTSASNNIVKPYYAIIVSTDGEKPVDSLKDYPEWASCRKNARNQFLRKYRFLKDYLESGMDIEVRFDPVAWQKELDKKARIEKSKQEEEAKIQDMWWNKD